MKENNLFIRPNHPAIIDKKYCDMVVTRKDWELPNSKLWLAKIEIDCDLVSLRDLDRHIVALPFTFVVSKLKIKISKSFVACFCCEYNTQWKSPKTKREKKKMQEQSLANVNAGNQTPGE